MPKYYVLAERPRPVDFKGLSYKSQMITWVNPFRLGIIGLVAIRTGEKRPPRAGEWYLSGAEPQAWRAPRDFETEYYILKLVTVVTTTTTTITEIS